MASNKIVLAVHVLDNADILRDYLAWYRHLGIDLVVANDFGSTDGSQDILDEFAGQGFVQWSHQRSKSAKDNDHSARLATLAREKYGAGWIILCDTDEFLTIADGDLRSVLARAQRDNVSIVNVNCLNMTGPPLRPHENPLARLTLRIDRTVVEPQESHLTGVLPVPYIFLRHPPKTIVRAEQFVGYAAGGHSAEATAGTSVEYPGLRFLHYPIRGYQAMQAKVAHTVTWFAENPHLAALPWWGWHWRRWIRLRDAGRLREDYDAQFVSAARAQELIGDGTCVVDESVARWIRAQAPAGRFTPKRLLARLFGSAGEK